jgi:phosphoribosylformimino-5-aminoimidazole carboxamide ribonucleotide (ProFAR) isomerase
MGGVKENIRKIAMEKFLLHFDYEEAKILVDEGLKSLEIQLNELQKAIERKDVENIVFHAHTVKGILLNLGLHEKGKAFGVAKDLYNQGKSADDIIEGVISAITFLFSGEEL